MTSTNGGHPAGPTDRIERIETVLEALIGTVQRLSGTVEQLASTVETANATAQQANQTANNTVLSLVDGFDRLMERIDTQGEQFLEIVGQVRDLQVQNSRILDRLEGLEGQGGQG